MLVLVMFPVLLVVGGLLFAKALVTALWKKDSQFLCSIGK